MRTALMVSFVAHSTFLISLPLRMKGLAYVHEKGIIHCDIKPANIFVTREGTGVIGDFDVSRDEKTRATAAAATLIGTLDYLPPEGTSQKGDVYN